jgi:hypothetical protein
VRQSFVTHAAAGNEKSGPAKVAAAPSLVASMVQQQPV